MDQGDSLSAGPLSTSKASDDHGAGGSEGRSAHWATLVFALCVVVSVPYIFHANREQWFFLDEWDFLSARELDDPGSLFRAHYGHWVTLPAIAYRLVFRLVGIQQYWPYQALAVGAHVTAAILLRVVLRRLRVNPWLATAAAVSFLTFGTGRMNIAWGFQITLTGSLLFGLLHLILTDVDGPWSRRDTAGLAFGLAALMCSGVGVAMVVATAVAVLLRRGWRISAGHAVPLAVVYVTWLLLLGRDERLPVLFDPARLMRFGADLLAGTVVGQYRFTFAAIAVAVVSATGWALLARDGWRAALRVHALGVGMAVGGVTFVGATASTRAAMEPLIGTEIPGRYLHISAALLLPVSTVGVSAVVARWPRLFVPTTLLLLVGVTANVHELTPRGSDRYMLGSPAEVTTLARVAAETRPPADLQPSWLYPGVTSRWLIDLVEADGLPGVVEAADASGSAKLLFALEEISPQQGWRCSPAQLGPVRLRPGDGLAVASGRVTVAEITAGGEVGPSFFPQRTPSDDLIHLRAWRALDLNLIGVEPPSASVAICR